MRRFLSRSCRLRRPDSTSPERLLQRDSSHSRESGFSITAPRIRWWVWPSQIFVSAGFGFLMIDSTRNVVHLLVLLLIGAAGGAGAQQAATPAADNASALAAAKKLIDRSQAQEALKQLEPLAAQTPPVAG